MQELTKLRFILIKGQTCSVAISNGNAGFRACDQEHHGLSRSRILARALRLARSSPFQTCLARSSPLQTCLGGEVQGTSRAWIPQQKAGCLPPAETQLEETQASLGQTRRTREETPSSQGQAPARRTKAPSLPRQVPVSHGQAPLSLRETQPSLGKKEAAFRPSAPA